MPAEVPMSSKEGMRAFDLRDARKVGAYPSVTTVLKLLDKPGLRQWIRNRDIEVALTMPTLIHVQDKIERVKEESDRYVKWAADFGTRVHLGISMGFQKEQWWEPDDAIRAVVEGFWDWYHSNDNPLNVTVSERSFISPLGFAGTMDCEGEDFIGDIKTQDFDSLSEANVYVEHPLQLAGYAVGTGQRSKRRFELIVSRTTPGLVKLHAWKQEDNDRNDRAWLALWELWQHLKNYYPGGEEWQKQIQTRGRLPQALAAR